MRHSTGFTLLFAAAVCVVCSVFVAGSAVALKDRQEANKALDLQRKVLAVAGVVAAGESLSDEQVGQRFQQYIRPMVVTLKTGEVDPSADPKAFDQRAASKDPAISSEAPANDAKVKRIPNQALMYHVVDGETLQALILPVEGKGLWSTLYGFLALAPDARTIQGITFYAHGETPGLGGEVDNDSWKALWKGRKAFDDQWKPKITVKKGTAGPVAEDPYQVDGLSGATLTSRGVTFLVQFWLAEHGFGPYLEKYRSQAKGG